MTGAAVPTWFETVKFGVELLVALGTLALAYFTWRLAKTTAVLADEGHKERTQAERLFKLQREDFELRQRSDSPNLQLFDVRVDASAGVSLPARQLLVEVMNFGRRPARIRSATFEAAGTPPIVAQPFSSACARHEEIVRFELTGTIKHAIARLFRDIVDGVPVAQPLDEQLGRLIIAYTEVDGTGAREETFEVPLLPFRRDQNRPEFVFRILPAPRHEQP